MLIVNIAAIQGIVPSMHNRLAGADMESVPEVMADAWLRVEDGRIAGFGPMSSLAGRDMECQEVVDARGGMLLPSFCDSHTHVVYAGSRDGEFLDKINGLSYEEIARRGGGILNSADRLHYTGEDELYSQAMERVN